MKETGTEGLEGDGKKREEKRPEKRDEKKGEKKSEKKGERKDGLKLTEVRVRPLHDGTHHIEHYYEDKHGMPHHQTHGFSAPDKQGVADHMMEHLPEAPEEQEEEAEAAAGAGAGGGEAQPSESQPGAAAEPGA